MFKRLKKKMFWVIWGGMTIVGTIAGTGIFYVGEKVRGLAMYDKELILETLAIIGRDNLYFWAIPSVIAFFSLFGIVVWAVIVSSMRKQMSEESFEDSKGRKTPRAPKDFLDHKIDQERKRRLFLHSLSILQREGRLLDFFDEDLSRYEDDQIGAAVRSIQEDCKKAVKKYIDPRPVLEGNEGDAVTIEEGFDIDAVTLVGNVSGQPPFEGVIKHPGWKAGKKDVPKLSDIQDPSIMTPAEVEIQ